MSSAFAAMGAQNKVELLDEAALGCAYPARDLVADIAAEYVFGPTVAKYVKQLRHPPPPLTRRQNRVPAAGDRALEYATCCSLPRRLHGRDTPAKQLQLVTSIFGFLVPPRHGSIDNPHFVNEVCDTQRRGLPKISSTGEQAYEFALTVRCPPAGG